MKHTESKIFSPLEMKENNSIIITDSYGTHSEPKIIPSMRDATFGKNLMTDSNHEKKFLKCEKNGESLGEYIIIPIF